MTIKVNQIYKLGTFLILILVFLVGGFIQYFIGVPNTAYTLVILAGIFVLVLLDIVLRVGILRNRIILLCLFILGIIILSGIINNSGLFKTILYSIFSLLPLGIFYFFGILEKRNVRVRRMAKYFFQAIVILQLPIILLQKYAYSFLIKFNNSNQAINDYDFMFGSFFIRADHSLGFFLLMYLLGIFIDYRRSGNQKINWFIIVYISITILIMESNLTKALLIMIIFVYLLKWLYRKISMLGILIMLISAYFIFMLSLKIPGISAEVDHFVQNYTIEKSYQAFEGTYARRPQVAIVYLTHFPLKLLGEGPYDYFDIFKGEFKKSKHFSQMIWSYNDLGIIGLMAFIVLIFFISGDLGLINEVRWLLFGILLFYLFMTNVFSDLGIGLSLLLVNQRIR